MKINKLGVESVREIKFRVWNGDCFEYSRFNFKTGSLGCNFSSYVELDTPQQFTGLTDKNGVDIYEGDILKARDKVGEVVWDDGFCGFSLIANFKGGKSECVVTHPTLRNAEVIGNTHQNPDLVKAT